LQSYTIKFGPGGEINYRHSTDGFFPRHRSRPYREFALRAFYKDGRFRVVSFIVESFYRSQCYQKGHAHCGHCHDYHPSDGTNIRALKFLDQPDQMCLQCHAEYAAKLEEHTRHQAASEGSRCVACHMPKIMSSVLFKTCTHQIGDTPNWEMTARFGQDESPNACFICHKDKSVAWLKQELSQWPRRESRVVSKACGGPPSAGASARKGR
jgi:predicted CXXCH cytochrome family protein